MTKMKIVSFPVPDALDKRIHELKKDDKFSKCSYSEIVRQLLTRGLEHIGEG